MPATDDEKNEGHGISVQVQGAHESEEPDHRSDNAFPEGADGLFNPGIADGFYKAVEEAVRKGNYVTVDIMLENTSLIGMTRKLEITCNLANG